MKLLGISGTIIGEKTHAVVSHVVRQAALLDHDLETELLDLRDYDVQFCDGRKMEAYNDDTQEAVNKVLAADCFIIGTPIFQASLAAPLKNLFDLVPPDAFRHKVIGFIGTGGTYQHYLVIENQLKPIAGYFRAYTAPDYVYAHRDHFNGNNEIADPSVLERIEALASQVLHMSRALRKPKQ
ncbi:NADPH-dependent FMN reductase [Paenibacillus beijingensis]|uniref:NADH-dependent FMN reductase n=1 Tax=Paenibacillus beijingensis TaxID=1126833 RepID=A0A0D5NQQ1_9BACL|nr:NAD(P)H-dependent oxidoreductase [Paenibacillus beijingensis]AJY77322.1 NADH-dependent FMN reductase [Paenibacillus beijingensis]